MEQLKEFVLKHFKVITVVLTFVLTMYIQHESEHYGNDLKVLQYKFFELFHCLFH